MVPQLRTVTRNKKGLHVLNIKGEEYHCVKEISIKSTRDAIKWITEK